MDQMRRKARFAAVAIGLLLGSGLIIAGTQDPAEEEQILERISSSDCTFLNNPLDYTKDDALERSMRTDQTNQISVFAYSADAAANTVNAGSIPHKNFIDQEIFSRMAAAGIPSAPLSSDAEYLRRVYLDLTGRIPSASDVDAFLSNTSATKRDAIVDALIATPEFIDKWTMFFGDLYKNTAVTTNVNRFAQGRDAMNAYVRDALINGKPYDQMAYELLTATGDSFINGAANWMPGTTIAMGPIQDTYDGGAYIMSQMFMGINAVDCLLCHDGPRHLDQVNLWGATQTRQNMWGLSAYFARTRMVRQAVPNTNLSSFVVSDVTAGNYNLNTTTGNRSARQPVNGVTFAAPRYPFSTAPLPGGGVQAGETYRQALARQITSDLQFSRAIVNYIWEAFMVEGFVSPSNSFDLARLDPNSPPPDSWGFQPTNPQLLDTMARWFQQNRYDLRALMALIAKSNAYQLSSAYDSTWSIDYVPYYARKYVRRLSAEEVHDAITKATNLIPTYTLPNGLPSVQWAMQLPDTLEPNSNGAGRLFLNAFNRGDRDLNPRRTDGTILQGLTMMNNTFVTSRMHRANAGSRVQTLLAQTADPETIIQTLFKSTLSRPATSQELSMFMTMFQQQGNITAAENLQWVLLNKLQFLFNY